MRKTLSTKEWKRAQHEITIINQIVDDCIFFPRLKPLTGEAKELMKSFLHKWSARVKDKKITILMTTESPAEQGFTD